MEIIEKTTFDRLYSLQVAMVVEREGTFVKASKSLGISPSNVTKEIQKIESYLGVKLFKRTTRSFVLTEEGRLALKKTRVLLEELASLEEEVHGVTDSVKGLIRVTAPATIGQSYLSDLFAKFQLDYPYIELDLIFTDTVLDPVEHDIDLSIRTSFQLKDSGLFVREVAQIERVICASKDYLNRFKIPKGIDALGKHNCLVFLRGDTPFVWSFRKNGIQKDIQVKGSYRSNNLLSLVSACKQGVGILNVPRYLVEEEIKSGELKVLLKSWELPTHRLFFLSSRHSSASKKLAVLKDFLAENIKTSI